MIILAPTIIVEENNPKAIESLNWSLIMPQYIFAAVIGATTIEIITFAINDKAFIFLSFQKIKHIHYSIHTELYTLNYTHASKK